MSCGLHGWSSGQLPCPTCFPEPGKPIETGTEFMRLYGPQPTRADAFKRELAQLINRYSFESGSNTPDFVLADYLFDCLMALNRTIRHRDRLRDQREWPESTGGNSHE